MSIRNDNSRPKPRKPCPQNAEGLQAEIVDENKIDLAILGTHGETDFSRYMMGGVSAKIVRTSPIPVMWIRELKSSE